jgi:hypothetical protein
VYDTLFEATWETLQQFGKQGSTNGNDSRFAHLGQQLSLHPHLHCIVPGGGVDKEEQWKIVEVMVNSVKALSKVLELLKTQSKRAYKIRANKTRFMEETFGFCQETKVCGGIFGGTIKSHKQP